MGDGWDLDNSIRDSIVILHAKTEADTARILSVCSLNYASTARSCSVTSVTDSCSTGVLSI